MSTSLTLARGFVHLGRLAREEHFFRDSTIPRHSIAFKRRRRLRLVPNARWSGGSDRKTWWQKLFFDEDAESWFGVTEKDALEDVDGETDGEASEEEKFEAWKKRAEVITELREAQEDARNSDAQAWEDWLLESPPGADTSSRHREWDDGVRNEEVDIAADSSKAEPGENFVGAVKDFLFKSYDDDLLFEDKVFRYASVNSVCSMLNRTQLALLSLFPILLCRWNSGFSFCLSEPPPISLVGYRGSSDDHGHPYLKLLIDLLTSVQKKKKKIEPPDALLFPVNALVSGSASSPLLSGLAVTANLQPHFPHALLNFGRLVTFFTDASV